MSVLFTDLDNTMIYSHHRNIGDHKIVVEYYEGREQSFMTESSYDFFTSADWLDLIPVTTRTEEQYKRIVPALRSRFKCALVCNGGKLLVDDREDEEWSRETVLNTKDNFDGLEDAAAEMSRICSGSRIHRPEKYMSYVKCDDPVKVHSQIAEIVDHEKVNVHHDDRKVYIFANGISKGTAVERLVKRMKFENILAAGDSKMDISMLEKADYAFTNREVYDLISCARKYRAGEDVLSDGICRYLRDLKNEGLI